VFRSAPGEQPSAEANDGLIGELQKSWWVEDVRVALTVADDIFSSMSAPAFLERPGREPGKWPSTLVTARLG
jgi:hypothetical protein